MPKRIQQINELIKRELGQIILRESEFPPGVLATITKIETSEKLDQAKAYISVIPEAKTENVMQILKKQIYELQQSLNHRLKMRPIPKINFVREENTAKAGKIERILEQLKK